MDWQPIATAPKDGTQIIVWSGDRAWVAHFGTDHHGETEWLDEGDWGEDYLAPTHWLPLPAAPVK